jgi:hypothetical protein
LRTARTVGQNRNPVAEPVSSWRCSAYSSQPPSSWPLRPPCPPRRSWRRRSSPPASPCPSTSSRIRPIPRSSTSSSRVDGSACSRLACSRPPIS